MKLISIFFLAIFSVSISFVEASEMVAEKLMESDPFFLSYEKAKYIVMAKFISEEPAGVRINELSQKQPIESFKKGVFEITKIWKGGEKIKEKKMDIYYLIPKDNEDPDLVKGYAASLSKNKMVHNILFVREFENKNVVAMRYEMGGVFVTNGKPDKKNSLFSLLERLSTGVPMKEVVKSLGENEIQAYEKAHGKN